MLMRRFDRDALRQQFASARPFPFVKIDEFLDPAFAKEVAAAYPAFEVATKNGRTFESVNERKKVQVTNVQLFPQPVRRLNELLASKEFLSDLSYITGIPNLLADDELIGGGMHVTGPGGRLDVHVDFNYIESRKLHRRLNLLIYLNPTWNDGWGGHIQLWDKDVKTCVQAFAPALNRCVIFETSEISFHGVIPVTPEAPFPRISFATYYYTLEAPARWTGVSHSTIFKARPDERLRAYLLMPAQQVQNSLRSGVQRMKRGARRLLKGS